MPKHIVKKIWVWIIGISSIIFIGTILYVAHAHLGVANQCCQDVDTFELIAGLIAISLPAALPNLMLSLVVGSVLNIIIEFVYFMNSRSKKLYTKINWLNILISIIVIVVFTVAIIMFVLAYNSQMELFPA